MSRLEHGRRVINQMIDTLGAGSKDVDCVNHVIQQAQKAEELQERFDILSSHHDAALAKVEELEIKNADLWKSYTTKLSQWAQACEGKDKYEIRSHYYKQALEELREKTKESVWHADIYIIVSKALKGVEG